MVVFLYLTLNINPFFTIKRLVYSLLIFITTVFSFALAMIIRRLDSSASSLFQLSYLFDRFQNFALQKSSLESLPLYFLDLFLSRIGGGVDVVDMAPEIP